VAVKELEIREVFMLDYKPKVYMDVLEKYSIEFSGGDQMIAIFSLQNTAKKEGVAVHLYRLFYRNCRVPFL
jgi:hypothetical protein